MSAHSLRKKLQTDLEKAGINSNWIDQMLGHQLINSRDAYSLPTVSRHFTANRSNREENNTANESDPRVRNLGD